MSETDVPKPGENDVTGDILRCAPRADRSAAVDRPKPARTAPDEPDDDDPNPAAA